MNHISNNFDKKYIFVILSLLGFLFAMYYIKTSNVEPKVSQPIITMPKVPFEHYIGASGISEANTENIAVGTSVSGIVKEIYAKIGDAIHKDQPLFLIDNRQQKALVLEAEANLEQAKANFMSAMAQYETIMSIKDNRSISKDEINTKKYAVDISRAQIHASASFLQAQRELLDLYLVKAPIDGIILSSNIRLGEYAQNLAQSASAPLFRVGNLTPMHIRVSIDENDAYRFKPGARAVAFLMGNPKIKMNGEFVYSQKYVTPKVNLTGISTELVDTRVLDVIYKFDASNLPIYAGQQFEVYIEEQKEEY